MAAPQGTPIRSSWVLVLYRYGCSNHTKAENRNICSFSLFSGQLVSSLKSSVTSLRDISASLHRSPLFSLNNSSGQFGVLEWGPVSSLVGTAREETCSRSTAALVAITKKGWSSEGSYWCLLRDNATELSSDKSTRSVSQRQKKSLKHSRIS